MTTTHEYDLLAIGGGTAGLVSAAGAAYLGARSALVEKAALGGDCLWTGCVPSKALIASARLAHAMKDAGRLGLEGVAPAHAFGDVMSRMRGARATVAHHDDPQRFRDMGVDVHFGAARFIGPDTVEVEGVGRIRSKRIVVATGARSVAPQVPGLEEAGYLTHVTALDRDDLPATLVVLGGGAIGLEFAQVYARLGATVTVLEMLPQVLPKEDEDVAALLVQHLEDEGIAVHTGVQATAVEVEGCTKTVVTGDGRRFGAQEIFVATGRRPRTDDLGLDVAGVALDGSAIRVNARLRTTARGIWAAGDVTGGLQFTHVADYMAKVVIQNALFPVKTKVDYSTVPWVTYTDPEIAHVGLGQQEAESRGARTYTFELSDLDRSIVDGETGGLVKISADGKGRILGASVVGSFAGELIFPLVMAMKHGISLAKLSGTIFPYPTRMEGLKRSADAFQRERLEGSAGRLLRKAVSWLT